jgi:hypothetical protein
MFMMVIDESIIDTNHNPNTFTLALQVSSVMKKASTLKVAAKLRDLTSYCAVRENNTRWSSTFQMVQRFLNIERELSRVVELLPLLPNHLEIAYLREAFESLKKFDSITVMLQHERMSFVESREIFDLFLTDYPDFAHYISDDALIVENELFEKAVMRIARNLPLSDEQEALMVPLLKEEYPAVEALLVLDEQEGSRDSDNQNTTYSEELQRKLKRRRIEQLQAERAKVYVDLSVVPGTSVNCERLFSAAKFILSDTRKRTSPKLFEALLLLKVNRNYWNLLAVGKAMGRTVDGGGNIVSEEDMLDAE